MRRSSLLLPLTLAIPLAISCRSAGGPVLDAADIVEGHAAPGVHTDTVDESFTVSIGRARWSARARPEPGADFWTDIEVLDVENAARAARTVDEKTFVVALRTLMEGDPDGAVIAFSALRVNSSDPVVRARARIGLTMALSWHSDWAGLARIGEDPDSAVMAREPLARQAGVERWGRALAALPPPVLTIPDQPVVLPMRRSVFGTPVVTVRVNGHSYDFWLDTGASMTLLSSAVAVDAGVLLAAPDTLALGVVAGHIAARAVFLDSLAIGPVVVRGLGAALVSPGTLRLDRRTVNGLTEPVRIDGVIGTDLLRHLDIVLDAREQTITIRKPQARPHSTRNLYWVGYPVVKLVTREGRPVLFGLDTGAEGSYVTTSLLRKLPRTPVARRRTSLGGLGTEREQSAWVARDLALSDGDYALTLRNAPVVSDHRWTFITFDGIIGSDIALASRLHLDFANGIFDVRPSQGPLEQASAPGRGVR